MRTIYDPNDFTGTDIDRLNDAVRQAAERGGKVRITSRKEGPGTEGRPWLIDSAILLPGGIEIELVDCTIKLSDRCRDNFFRSANCGPEGPVSLSSIHIRGIGAAILQGADHPRATGDSAKRLGLDTYGTDAGDEGSCPRGDWRNIGILLVGVRDFSVTGLTIIDSHGWAISLEHCSDGLLRDLTFRSRGLMTIDGKEERSRNQDGIDLRRGCHDIVLETIRGETGDDLIAMTALAGRPHDRGAHGYCEITSPSEDPRDDDIHSVVIRDVRGYSACDGQIVRFLNASGLRLHDVTLDGLLDTSPEDWHCHAAVRIGDDNPAWGGVAPLGDTSGLRLRSIRSNAKQGVLIIGTLVDSTISDVVNLNPEAAPVRRPARPAYLRNVAISGLVHLSPPGASLP